MLPCHGSGKKLFKVGVKFKKSTISATGSLTLVRKFTILSTRIEDGEKNEEEFYYEQMQI
jgi:hypothetical protein